MNPLQETMDYDSKLFQSLSRLEMEGHPHNSISKKIETRDTPRVVKMKNVPRMQEIVSSFLLIHRFATFKWFCKTQRFHLKTFPDVFGISCEYILHELSTGSHISNGSTGIVAKSTESSASLSTGNSSQTDSKNTKNQNQNQNSKSSAEEFVYGTVCLKSLMESFSHRRESNEWMWFQLNLSPLEINLKPLEGVSVTSLPFSAKPTDVNDHKSRTHLHEIIPNEVLNGIRHLSVAFGHEKKLDELKWIPIPSSSGSMGSSGYSGATTFVDTKNDVKNVLSTTDDPNIHERQNPFHPGFISSLEEFHRFHSTDRFCKAWVKNQNVLSKTFRDLIFFSPKCQLSIYSKFFEFDSILDTNEDLSLSQQQRKDSVRIPIQSTEGGCKIKFNLLMVEKKSSLKPKDSKNDGKSESPLKPMEITDEKRSLTAEKMDVSLLEEEKPSLIAQCLFYPYPIEKLNKLFSLCSKMEWFVERLDLQEKEMNTKKKIYLVLYQKTLSPEKYQCFSIVSF